MSPTTIRICTATAEHTIAEVTTEKMLNIVSLDKTCIHKRVLSLSKEGIGLKVVHFVNYETDLDHVSGIIITVQE